jgi:hypothetical protein
MSVMSVIRISTPETDLLDNIPITIHEGRARTWEGGWRITDITAITVRMAMMLGSHRPTSWLR